MPKHAGIAYKDGYKYQLAEDEKKAPGGWYRFQLSHEGIANHISTAWIRLDGRVLSIRVGFAWNGGNFPARDTIKAMPGFLLLANTRTSFATLVMGVTFS